MSEFSEGQWQRTISLLRGGLALYSPHISLSCVNSLGKLSFSSGEPHHHHHHPLQVTWANPVVWAIERPSVAGRVAQSQLEKLFCLQIGQHLPRESVPGTLGRNPFWTGHWTALLNIIDFLELKEIVGVNLKMLNWVTRCWSSSKVSNLSVHCN